MIDLASSPFDQWAIEHQYDIAPAVLPTEIRAYADRQTQAAFDAWNAGTAHVARIITESWNGRVDRLGFDPERHSE